MKKILLFTIFSTFTTFVLFYPFSCLKTYAINTDYSLNTTKKDIEFKKSKALAWNDIYKESESLKKKALKWYENNFVNNKSYFVNETQEADLKKTKALKWYERNSL